MINGTTNKASGMLFQANSVQDVNLSALGTGNSMYSLTQHRSFYEVNKKLMKQSHTFKNTIKNVQRALAESCSPNKKNQKGRMRGSRQIMLGKAKLNLTAEAALQKPPGGDNKNISAAISTIQNLQNAIEQDSNRHIIAAPQTKKWEYLRYKGKNFTPHNLLKITKRQESKHGKNVNQWTHMREKNNNIDWDAKKSFENLRKKIDKSDQTVARIRHGGISLFDSNTSTSGVQDLSNSAVLPHQSQEQSVNPLLASQMSSGGMKKVNVPILDQEDYRRCISQYARCSTPADQMNSTMKKWYQKEKPPSPDITRICIQNGDQSSGDEALLPQTLSPRQLSQKLDFPNNPAFFPDKGDFLRQKLKSAMQYCRDKKIALNQKQQIQMNVRRSQNTYVKFSNAVDGMFKGKSIDEGEYFLQKLKQPMITEDYLGVGGDIQQILLLTEKSKDRRNAFNANLLLENERYRDTKQDITEKQIKLKMLTANHVKEQFKKDEVERQEQFVRLSDYLNNPMKFQLQDERVVHNKRLVSQEVGSRNKVSMFGDERKQTTTQNIRPSVSSGTNHRRTKSSGIGGGVSGGGRLYCQKLDGTYQITKMTKTGQANKIMLSRKLNEILNRVELDRPILFQEKLDVIWNASAVRSAKIEKEDDKSNVDACRNIRMALDKKKKDRQKINSDQRLVYKKLLNFLKQRPSHPLQDEIQLLNVIKIIIDGGWIITQEEFDKLMIVLGIPNELQQNHPQFMSFLQFCLEELRDVNLIHSQ